MHMLLPWGGPRLGMQPSALEGWTTWRRIRASHVVCPHWLANRCLLLLPASLAADVFNYQEMYIKLMDDVLVIHTTYTVFKVSILIRAWQKPSQAGDFCY